MQTKERILEAASRVVARDGSSNLTLEAVASEADFSKGGLLYHYASKRELLEGMLDAMLQQTQQSLLSRSNEAAFKDNFIAAFIDGQHEHHRNDDGRLLALLAVAAQDPSLLASAKQQNSQWLKNTEAQGELATALLLATLGLRLLGHLQMLPGKPGQASKYYKLLATLAKDL